MRWWLCALMLLGCDDGSSDSAGDSGAPDAADLDAAARDGRVPDAAADGQMDAPDGLDGALDVAAPTPDAAGDAGPDGNCGVETCDGQDDDCDGVVDEGFGVGAPCAAGQGICAAAGVVECAAGEAVCVGDVGMPQPETCNGRDDDCDGETDEAFAREPCYEGPRNTEDVGRCVGGGTACVNGAPVCVEQIRPAAEACDGADADCDGLIDEGCATCGDGAMDRGEDCDDGNQIAGDGCSVNCEREVDRGGLVAGIQRNVPIRDVTARSYWPCYGEVYAEAGAPIDDVLAACAGTQLLIGCRRTGETRLLVAAEGDFAEVTRDVGGDANGVNPHNGVDFYFSRSASWGFAPPGAGVNRNTCDTNEPDDPNRMCWHTAGDAMRGGWRCGTNTRLNESRDFERVVFSRTTVALGAQRAFGHHGDCDSFNACVDAENCANAACEHLGRGEATSWREGRCLDVPGLDCDMFLSVPDDLDEDWVPGCNAPVAYDVVCSGGAP